MAVRAVTGYLSVVLSFIVERIAQPLLLPFVEANLIPDFLVRWGIRQLLAGQAASLDKGSPAANVAAKMAYVKDLKTRDIAECTINANEQHYEASGSLGWTPVRSPRSVDREHQPHPRLCHVH